MNYVVNKLTFEIDNKYYCVYLHSDHLIVHQMLDNNFDKSMKCFQFRIEKNKICLNEVFTQERGKVPPGRRRITEEDFPFVIINHCNRVLQNKSFW